MHINDIDLNLLRIFDAIYRLRSVSRAADLVGLTQPATSHGLARLRLLLQDALFVRAQGGVKPTPRAERLAGPVQLALSMVEQALNESAGFDPLHARKVFRLHMSDIGEWRFVPALMVALRELAPGVRIETLPLARDGISEELNNGRIHFAFGFLPQIKETRNVKLIQDRYIILLRHDHPFLLKRRRGKALLADLRELEFVAVRTHADTLRILRMLNLEDRLRLTMEHFMVLPAVVRATDLVAVMPRNIALGFTGEGGYAIIEPDFPLRDFTVSLHWSKRFEADPANRWLKELIVTLFSE